MQYDVPIHSTVTSNNDVFKYLLNCNFFIADIHHKTNLYTI